MMSEENKRPDEELSSPAQPIEDLHEEDALSAFEQVAAPQKETKKKRLSSNTRLLIIVTAIVAVLAILLAVLLPLLSEGTSGSGDASNTVSVPEKVYPLYDRSKDKTEQKIVQSIAIKNKDDEYTIRYNTSEKLYQLVGYTDLSLYESYAEELVGCATTLNGYDKVQNVEKLADFGLDDPAVTVVITYYDNTTNTLLIGDQTPDQNGYYARLQDSDEVVMLDVDTVYAFQRKKGQYVERTLLASPTVKDNDANGTVVLKELTLKGGPGKETLSLRQSGTSDGQEYSYSTFIITEPYKRMVSEEISEKLSNFTYLIASEGVVLHPTAADKVKYGFNDPYAVLDITLAVQTVKQNDESATESTETTNLEYIYYNSVTTKLTVGSKNDNGDYYVMIDGHNAIYLVSSSQLANVVERTYVNTISELLFLKTITNLKQVSISADGKTYNFALTHDKSKEEADDKLTVVCDGKTLDTQDFRTLYSRLISIARYGETNKTPTGQPLYKIVLIENDGSIFLTLEVHEHTSSLYTVRTDEGELFTVKVSDMSYFISLVKDYYDGTPVANM